jgi:ketosteroid isomerase-like protein
MPYWLVEGDLTLYAILAAVGLVCVAVWWRTRQRKYAVVAAGAAAAILALSMLDRLIESDREQMIRKVQEIAEGVRARDFQNIFRHVSDDFRRGAFDKPQFRDFAQDVSRRRNVTEFQAWGFVPGDVSRHKRRGNLEFLFKIRGNWSAGNEYFLARTVWQLDSDGEWRLQTFDVFNPYSDSNSSIQIPGWPR